MPAHQASFGGSRRCNAERVQAPPRPHPAPGYEGWGNLGPAWHPQETETLLPDNHKVLAANSETEGGKQRRKDSKKTDKPGKDEVVSDILATVRAEVGCCEEGAQGDREVAPRQHPGEPRCGLGWTGRHPVFKGCLVYTKFIQSLYQV